MGDQLMHAAFRHRIRSLSFRWIPFRRARLQAFFT